MQLKRIGRGLARTRAWALAAAIVLARAAGAQEAGEVERELGEPAFSADAKRLAYTAREIEAGTGRVLSCEVWAANRDGSGARRLASGPDDARPRWSPDNRRIAFERGGDIWIVNADGSGARAVTRTPAASEKSPEFSNDGKILFFVRSNSTQVSEGLFTSGPGAVIAHSLASGQERERFKGPDDVLQIACNRADSNEVLLLFDRFTSHGKAGSGAGAFSGVHLDRARLDGSGRSTLWAPEPGSSRRIEQIYPTSSGVVARFRLPEPAPIARLSEEVGGEPEPLEFGPIAFADISRDGRLIAGTGPAEALDGAIHIYDTQSEQSTVLDRTALLDSEIVAEIAREEAAAFSPAREALRRGDAFFAREANGEAVAAYSEAIRLDPVLAEAYLKRGLSQMRRQESGAAVADFDRAIRLAPNDAEARLQRARAHFIRGDNARALADHNEAIRLAPRSARALRERAIFYLATGDNESAWEDEKNARELEK